MPPAKATPPLVLVCGDDDFAVKQRARQLYQDWCAELGGMDHEIIDAAAGNADEVVRVIGKLREALQTLPFFGGGKAVWFRDCNFLAEDRAGKSKLATEAVAALADELKSFTWSGVRLVISADAVDKRRAFYKTVEKIGAVEWFQGWSPEDKNWMGEAETWAARAFRERGKQVSDDALAELVTRVGPHARQLASEVEKAALHAGDRPEVTRADIEAVCARNKQARAFALADAFADRDLPRALRCLDEELWEIRLKVDKDKSEIGLLYGLIAKTRTLLLLQEAVREGWLKPGAGYDQIKSLPERVPPGRFPADRKYNPLAMHPYVVLNALRQTRNYTSAELVRAMEVLLQANRQLVSSSLEPALVLQRALVEILGVERRSSAAR